MDHLLRNSGNRDWRGGFGHPAAQLPNL